MKTLLLKTSIILSLLLLQSSCGNSNSAEENELLNTISGPVPYSDLGFALTHEHIMSNFGKSIEEASDYDEAALYAQVIPYLKYIKSLGVDSIFDCTTEYFGRRIDLLKEISSASGIQIITNTGIYGAAKDRYIPQFAYEQDAASLSQIWIDEFRNGIHGTDIKPGFIKLGFDEGTPSEIDKKLFEAGILAHIETGLTLAVHTGDNLEAVEFQTELLEKHGVDKSSWIWVHAHKIADDDILIKLASEGAWISLDGVNTNNYSSFVERIKKFQSMNLLNRILLSHDGNGFPRGRKVRDFDSIMKDLVPALLSSGFTQDEINQLMVQNPIDAFGLNGD